MKKAYLFLILGILSLVASLVMYQVGSNSSHLSELKDYFYVPLPLGIMAIVGAIALFNQAKKSGN